MQELRKWPFTPWDASHKVVHLYFNTWNPSWLHATRVRKQHSVKPVISQMSSVHLFKHATRALCQQPKRWQLAYICKPFAFPLLPPPPSPHPLSDFSPLWNAASGSIKQQAEMGWGKRQIIVFFILKRSTPNCIHSPSNFHHWNRGDTRVRYSQRELGEEHLRCSSKYLQKSTSLFPPLKSCPLPMGSVGRCSEVTACPPPKPKTTQPFTQCLV